MGIARINLNADGSEYANGLILLPDDWTCPTDITFKSGFSSTNSLQAYADYQTFTLAEWQKMEEAGTVFLPASGSRAMAYMSNIQCQGWYRSATPAGDNSAGVFLFYPDRAQTA